MNRYKKVLKIINNFYEIDKDNFGNQVFPLLKKILDFESGYIYFTSPRRLEYSYNPQKFSTCELKEELRLKNTVFGEIIISGNNFNNEDKIIFKTISSVIANILKDNEISKVITMQAEALQESFFEAKKSDNTKTKFLSHVSHELRTPLNSILGYSDLLTMAGELNIKQQEFVNDIKVSSLHLLDMINEILDMSKIEAGGLILNKREFDISIAINEVLNILKPLILKKNIKLTCNIKDESLCADYQKFQQILFNLMSNAIKYTKDKITIETQFSDKIFRLIVKDNGIGISDKNLDKIFEKFKQASESKEYSTGLGLTITKELVKLHNGEIQVKSSLNRGSEFIVEIPRR